MLSESSLKNYFLFFIIGLTFIYHLPTFIVQEGMTPGDAGGNLYLIQAVAQGDVPYRDFWWNYGPLSLYLNALFFKIFGADIHTAIALRVILKSLFAGLFFLASCRIMPLFSAVLATMALEVFMPEFKHNFAHYMGVCAEIAVLWSALSYYIKPHFKYVWLGFLAVVVLGFIKLNFGLMFLIALSIVFILSDIFVHRNLTLKAICRYGYFILLSILMWAGVHALMFQGATWEQINQCFPVAKNYRYYDNNGLSFKGFIDLFNASLLEIKRDRVHAFMAFIGGIAACLLVIFSIYRRTLNLIRQRHWIFILFILFVLGVAGFHEFFKGKADYQIYWAKPFSVIIIAYLLSEASLLVRPWVRVLIGGSIIAVIALTAYTHWNLLERYQKDKGRFFDFKHMNVYVSEHPKDVRSMVETARFIQDNIPPTESFYTFPHTAIYYFLTDRHMPHWLFCFWRLSRISLGQELDLIQTLEKKKVNYIVQGSVCYAGLGAWGRFGEDHGRLFDKYIKKYFVEIKRIGEWKQEGDKVIYAGGMGTRIFKRAKEEYVNITIADDLD